MMMVRTIGVMLEIHLMATKPGIRLLGWGGRFGKSVKNSTDTIFELEILAQKTRGKIRINVQK